MRKIHWESGIALLLQSVDLFTNCGLNAAQIHILFDLMMAYQTFVMRRTRENTQLFATFMDCLKNLVPTDNTVKHVDDELAGLTDWLRQVLPKVRQSLCLRTSYADRVFRVL